MQSITDCVLHDTSAAFLCEKSTAEIKERLDGHFQETKVDNLIELVAPIPNSLACSIRIYVPNYS